MIVPVEAMSDSRASAQPSGPESDSRRTVQRVSTMKRKAVVDYGIDYGLHNMQGTAGLYYVSNPVSCIIIYGISLRGSCRVGILVRRGFWSGRTKIPRKRPDKTVRPRDFGPGTEVLV